MRDGELVYGLIGSQRLVARPWNATERSLAVVGAINFAYVAVQLMVATQAGSLAMLSDAFHNLSDVGAAFVAFKCERLRHADAPQSLPFGYLRTQVLNTHRTTR